MAYEGAQTKLIGVTASANLTAKQYYFVKVSGAGTVTVCAATTDQPIGVLQNAPDSGQAAEVCTSGITKISSDAAITAGNDLGCSADGQAAVYAQGSDTTKYIVARALDTTTAAAGLVTAYLNIGF